MTTLSTVFSVIGAVAVTLLTLSLHTVPEGHMGVYYRGGALLPRVVPPGYHVKIPFVDAIEAVQVTVQTDNVVNIPCGTSGGVLLRIDRVEVVNRLRAEYVFQTVKNYTVHYDKVWIFDKIHHEINQFCSRHTLQEVYIEMFHSVDEMILAALQQSCNEWAPGIEIIAIRITKPVIPKSVMANYEQMEAEKTMLKVASEKQKTIEKEAETERKRATIQAQKEAEVARIEAEKHSTTSEIRMRQMLLEKEAEAKMAALEDAMIVSRQRARTDAAFYERSKMIESNQLMYTREFLVLEAFRALANNTKVFFGPSAVHGMLAEIAQTLGASSPVDRALEAVKQQ